MPAFSKTDALYFGWEQTKSNLGFFLALQILWWVVYLVPYTIAWFVAQENPALGAVLSFVDFILTMLITLGIVRVGLSFVDNMAPALQDLFAEWQVVPRFFVATILYLLVVGLGLLLFIVPGIILMLRLSCYPYLLVDRKMGVIEALSTSAKITKGSVGNIFLFNLLLSGVALAGALFFLIGLFAAIPVALVSAAYVYRRLLVRAEEHGLIAREAHRVDLFSA